MNDENNKTVEPNATEALIKTLERSQQLEQNRINQDEKNLKWGKLKFYLIVAFFALGALPYMGAMYKIFGENNTTKNDYVDAVKLDGPIEPGEKNSAEKINQALDTAFNDKKAKGIVFLVNSPGGTPVQAALIADYIKMLRKEHPKKKIITVAEDVMASGAYMAAMGTHTIYAHKSSIVGSIGVVTESFGYPKIMKKIGLERRVHVSGKYKRSLDPYFPEKPEDVKIMQKRLDDVHNQFITIVKKSRGNRLKASDDVLFNAEVWTGDEALKLGLIDGLGSIDSIIRKEFGVKYYKVVTEPVPFIDQFTKSIRKQVSLLYQKILTSNSSGNMEAILK